MTKSRHMFGKRKRRGHGLLRFLAAVLGVLTVVVAIGASYQLIGARLDAKNFPAPGRMVDVGGYSMHIYCRGRGSPPVIFNTGQGVMSPNWAPIQEITAKATTACIFDRAGYGWSDPGPTPRTSERMAGELKRLLEGAGIDGPYILVSHSIAGIHDRVFAHLYPDAVAGMVLVDTSHEDQNERLALERDLDAVLRRMKICTLKTVTGYNRLFGDHEVAAIYPIDYHGSIRAWRLTKHFCSTLADEQSALEESFRQAREARDFGHMPLWVLTATAKGEGQSPEEARRLNDGWLELQREMLGFSTNSHHVIVEDSAHYIQNDRPEIVLKAIQSVIDELRGPDNSE